MDEKPWKAMAKIALRMSLQLAIVFLGMLQIAVVLFLQVALLVVALGCGILMAVGLVTQSARLFGIGFFGFLAVQTLFPTYIEIAIEACNHAISRLFMMIFQAFGVLIGLLFLSMVLAGIWIDRISLSIVGLLGILVLHFASASDEDTSKEGTWEDGWKSQPPEHLLSNRMKNRNEVIDDVKDLWK